MKPKTRGYIHRIAFFIACGTCLVLLAVSHGDRALASNIIYSLSLIGLYAVSSIYHLRDWDRRTYLLMKRLDHAAIFLLIAGTATPICLLGIKGELGERILMTVWSFATIGMLMTIFWTQAPKWLRTLFYVAIGWLALPYLPEMAVSLGPTNTALLVTGGVLYTVGALIYAFQRPDPSPRYFGYHEIFHTFVVIASGFHFGLIYALST